MITFYDLANNKATTWSPNPWKIRYLLNLKKLPYRTAYLEFPDITRVSEEAGIEPVGVRRDGGPLYTLPAIVDDATGVALSDSYKIAEYLDKQYPETPKAFPAGTEALQAAFYHYFNDTITWPIALTIVPHTPKLLNEGSMEYFLRTRAVLFGKPLDQLALKGEEKEKNWENLGTLFDSVESWYAKSKGRFLVGDTVSFGDFTVAGMLMAVRIMCGKESEDWERFRTMNGGRWAKLLQDVEEYADVSQ